MKGQMDERLILIRAKHSADCDWKDQISLAKQYFEFISHENDVKNTVAPTDWVETVDAWLEYKRLKELYARYTDLIIQDRIVEALEFTEEVLFKFPDTVDGLMHTNWEMPNGKN